MIHSIHNNELSVAISSKGAELQSIIHKDFGLEYMWSGDAAFWGKKSPVLFPIVGGLKNNSYEYKNKTYYLPRHGFARDMEFEVTEQQEDFIVFTLKSNEETLAKFPFDFKFSLRYSLGEAKLSVSYIVENTGSEDLFFSVGGHPAFSVPLVDGTVFEDHYLKFGAAENAGLWPLSADGLIENFTVPVLENSDQLPLNQSLFYKDAMVFKHPESKSISILNHINAHGLTLNFEGFPYMGIWNSGNANFVCIEPWCGIADSVNATGKLMEKEGINVLPVSKIFEKTWSVELF
ncbi:MAG TPA: aldose 1-epimerase family protein [Panacibacter sp.]|nr:aldose 1-epimerase family protein [Panacibacter sp.]